MKKMGRPKGDNNMVKSYSIRMDDATLARLEAYCKLMKVAKQKPFVKQLILWWMNVKKSINNMCSTN